MEKNIVLTLDGGGIRGLIQIRILKRILDKFPELQEKILFIGGTSVGAINGSGLGIGLKPAEVEKLLYEGAPEVFEDSIFDDIKDLGRLLGAQYSVFNLKDVLLKQLQQKKVKDLSIDCGFTVFDMQKWEPVFINSLEQKYDDMLLLDAVTGSGSALTFFELWKYMTDGGIWAVNPTMASLALLKSPASNLGEVFWGDIKILNIGSGDFHEPPMKLKHDEDIGYVQLAQLIPDVFLDGVNKMIATQAGWILHDDFHRVSPALPEKIGMDDWKKRDQLLDIAQNEDLSETFKWIEPFRAARLPDPRHGRAGVTTMPVIRRRRISVPRRNSRGSRPRPAPRRNRAVAQAFDRPSARQAPGSSPPSPRSSGSADRGRS